MDEMRQAFQEYFAKSDEQKIEEAVRDHVNNKYVAMCVINACTRCGMEEAYRLFDEYKERLGL